MEKDKPAPLWRRRAHLLTGVIVTLIAMGAIAILQVSQAREQRHAAAALSITLDMRDAMVNDSAPAVMLALHRKLLGSIAYADAPALETVGADLESLGPDAIEGRTPAVGRYTAALQDLYRIVDGDARMAAVRTQQLQMGIVAGAAIILIILLGSADARRAAEVVPRRTSPTTTATVDPLTGLGRIDTIRQRLQESLDRRKPKPGFVGLLAVGIQPEHEHFLPLTRAQLDAALVESVRRLREAVRATDVVALLARDELAVALPPTARVEDPGRVAGKILGALDEPIDVGDAVVRPNPRVGVAIAPLDASTPDGLIQRARIARRAASDAPAAVYRSYRDNIVPRELSRHEMHDQLEQALDAADGQLWVAYQPKIDLTDERVVGFEALARWDHPVLGGISPAHFIRVAEESDLILRFGAWVLDEVCAQVAAWQGLAGGSLPVSVNVSARQFEDAGLVSLVRTTLERHDVAPELIELELTEGILLEDRREVVMMMHDLSDLGVRLALDDFGTGYSALSYLKRFPIDVLKIDRAFIRNVHGDIGDEAISTAIISMAHSMALQVVAEGVETPEQLTALRSLGCDAAQGFYFAHPSAPAELRHRATV